MVKFQVLDQSGIDKSNQVKALFRRAKAHAGLKAFDAAQADLTMLLAFDAGNEEAKKFMADIKGMLEKEKKREQQVYSRMFS